MSSTEQTKKKKNGPESSPYADLSKSDKVNGTPSYELTFLLRSDMSSQDVKVFFERLCDKLEESNVSLKKLDYWGLRNLKYKIKKNKKAHFYCLNFTCDVGNTKELERFLSLNNSVLRYIIMRIRFIPDVKSPMLVNLEKDIADGIVIYDESYVVKMPQM